MKRLTVPRIRQQKGKEPLVMLTAYTVRMAQLMDPHCDMLLVGDSLGQVIYGLDAPMSRRSNALSTLASTPAVN